MPSGQLKAPAPDPICDIGRSGRLLEFGLDPFTRAYEVLDACVQTEERSRRTSAGADHGHSQNHSPTVTHLPGKSPPAAQVLRLVVGLLGLEVHQKPKNGSEAWLTFQDATNSKLGLGGLLDLECPDTPPSPVKTKSGTWGTGPEQQSAQQMEWQMRVLSHLRKHFAGGGIGRGGRSGSTDDSSIVSEVQRIRQPGSSGEKLKAFPQDDSGLDFIEHLEIAEYVLKRITHAVTVLQDPEKQDRPIVLREYTEKMVLDVCQDLRQWLEQLATVLSLYHVHILDLENERRRLQRLLSAEQAKCAASVAERKDAVLRHDVLKEKWEEEKMQRRAEVLLGITLSGEDEKIYTQKDVDRMFKEWENEHVEPLLQELRELRGQREGKKKSGRLPGVSAGALGPEAVAVLVQALNALGERLPDSEMGDAVERLADAVINGGTDIEVVLRVIERLPGCGSPTPTARFVMKGETQRAVVECLGAIGTEVELLDSRARAVPELRGLSHLATWAKDTLSAAKQSLQAEGGEQRSLEWSQAPAWDLGSIERRPSSKKGVSAGVKSAAATSGSTSDLDVNARLKRLQEDLEAKLRDALAQAEMWKKKWEEAMQKMADEAAKADQLLAELRKKMQDMENIMEQNGVGKQAADAIFKSGLSEFMQGRDVFERLYRDALNRMRRLAEAQARIFEETSDVFFRNIASLTDLEAYMDLQRRPSMHAREEGVDGRSPPTASAHGHPPGHRVLVAAAGAVPLSEGMPLQVTRLGHDRGMDIRTNQVQLRPLHAVTRDGWADLGVLPRLECRGRPVGNSPLRSASPAGTAAGADGCERKDVGRLAGGPRSRSPPRDEPAPEPSARAAEPPLSIGPLWGTKAVGALAQPLERPRKGGSGGGGGGGGSRPSTSGSGRPGRPARCLRSSGNSSMPHLSQPRLLVQSLGAAH